MKRLTRFLAAVLAAAAIAPCYAAIAEGFGGDDDYAIPEDGNSLYSPGMGQARDVSDGPLTAGDYPGTSATRIKTPESPGDHDFVVYLATPVAKVEKQLMPDNRIVLDFSVAANQLEDQYILNHPVVERIRTGQLNETTTRVVFDLKAGAEFKVFLSWDRRSLTVRFMKNAITSLYFYEKGGVDYIELTGEYCPILSVRPIAGTNRVEVDMPISVMAQPAKYYTDMNFVKIVQSVQADENTARLLLECAGVAEFSAEYSGNVATLRLSQATYSNIYYTGQKTLNLKKDAKYPISADQMARSDEYYNQRFVFTLPGKYSDWLGWGEYIINDENLHGVLITSADGPTKIVFEQKRVMAYEFWEDDEYIYIKPVQPRQKYDKIVILDPGHGGNQTGAAANGLVEKELNLDVCARAANLLDGGGGVKVYSTRVTDKNVDLYDRPVWASGVGDIFVSVHMNAMGGGNTSANGTEVYHYPHDNDAQIGYTGKDMAEIFQRNLVKDLGTKDLGVKSNRFVVIKNTTIPAILCEIGFLTNHSDASMLAQPSFRQRVAESLHRSILEVFSAYRPKR